MYSKFIINYYYTITPRITVRVNCNGVLGGTTAVYTDFRTLGRPILCTRARLDQAIFVTVKLVNCENCVFFCVCVCIILT